MIIKTFIEDFSQFRKDRIMQNEKRSLSPPRHFLEVKTLKIRKPTDLTKLMPK